MFFIFELGKLESLLALLQLEDELHQQMLLLPSPQILCGVVSYMISSCIKIGFLERKLRHKL
jgi:hypothetical protein